MTERIDTLRKGKLLTVYRRVLHEMESKHAELRKKIIQNNKKINNIQNEINKMRKIFIICLAYYLLTNQEIVPWIRNITGTDIEIVPWIRNITGTDMVERIRPVKWMIEDSVKVIYITGMKGVWNVKMLIENNLERITLWWKG